MHPSTATLPADSLRGPLGVHPLSWERRESPRLARAQRSRVQPEEQEGPAYVPGGGVLSELLLAAPGETRVNTACPALTPHQSHTALPVF